VTSGGVTVASGAQGYARDWRRVTRRLRVLFVLVSGLMVVFAGLAIDTVARLHGSAEDVRDQHLPTVELLGELRFEATRHHELMLRHVLEAEPGRMASVERSLAALADEVDDHLDDFGAAHARGGVDERRLRTVRAGWSAYLGEADRVLGLSRSNRPDQASELVSGRFPTAFSELVDEVVGWHAIEVGEARREARDTEELSHLGRTLLAVGMAILVIGLLWVDRQVRRALDTSGEKARELLADAERDTHRAALLRRLAERITFATTEDDIITAAAAAVNRLVRSERGDLLLLNPSKDRLTVGVAWGPDAPPAGSLVGAGSKGCPGVRRGAMHQADDVDDELAVRCRAHEPQSRSLICAPLVAMNQSVGVVHLERDEPFTIDDTHLVGQVCEQVALALANSRLMHTMENLAMTDSLTGLHNARFFDPLLDVELEAAARTGDPVAVLMLDLDNFKKLNDTHGHAAGDEALRSFARAVRANLRTSDVAARYGGEEFVVMLRASDAAEAEHVAEKLRAAVAATPVELAPARHLSISVSIGVATTTHAGYERATLLRLADRALYRAKQGGRNRVEVVDPRLDAAAPLALVDGPAPETASSPDGHRTDEPEPVRAHGGDPSGAG